MEVAAVRLPDGDLGPLIARGRDAEVFALGDDRVVRRTPDPRDLTGEAEVMEHVRAAGYPVPRVGRVAPGEIVMARVEGPTMLADLSRRPWRLRRHARTLADLHTRLHRITPPDGSVGPAVLHMDLHPANVMLAPAGPVVIDWTNATTGPPGLDLAWTWVVMVTAVLDEGEVPGPLGRLTGRVLPWYARRFIAAFLAAAGREDAEAQLPDAAARRLADPGCRPAEAIRVRALMTQVR